MEFGKPRHLQRKYRQNSVSFFCTDVHVTPLRYQSTVKVYAFFINDAPLVSICKRRLFRASARHSRMIIFNMIHMNSSCISGVQLWYICTLYVLLLQESEHGAVELPKMLSDSQRMCKVIVELIETERQYVRVSTVVIHSVIHTYTRCFNDHFSVEPRLADCSLSLCPTLSPEHVG